MEEALNLDEDVSEDKVELYNMFEANDIKIEFRTSYPYVRHTDIEVVDFAVIRYGRQLGSFPSRELAEKFAMLVVEEASSKTLPESIDDLTIVAFRAKDLPGVWLTHCLDLDMMSQGDTLHEALKNLGEVLPLCVNDDVMGGDDPFERGKRTPVEDWNRTDKRRRR